MQAHIGVALAHGAHQRHAQHIGYGGRQAHADGARQPRLLGGVNGLCGVAQGELGFMKKGLARFGGDDAARCALQQAGGEFGLQAADLLAERGLHHVQIQRGTAHGAQFNNSYKVAQLAQFHGKSSHPQQLTGAGIIAYL